MPLKEDSMTTRCSLPLAGGGFVLGLALLVVSPCSLLGAEPQRPNLQGTWVLNTYLTSQLMKDANGDQAPAQSGNGGHGHHSGGGGRSTGSGDGSSGGAKAADKGQDNTPLDTIIITQAAGQVTISDRDGHARVLKTNGAKVRDEKAPGGPAQVKCSWDSDGTLVVETKPDKGNSRTENYVVADDHKHLYLTITSLRDSKIVRAYDPAPVEPPADKTEKPPSRL
jgi:hypothetical protein